MGKRKQGWLNPAPASGPHETAATIVSAARQVAVAIGARTIMLFVDGLDDLEQARALIRHGLRLLMVARSEEQAEQARRLDTRVVTVPAVRLSRIDQLKMAILFAFSQGLLQAGETFVGLVGLAGNPIDSMMVMRAGRQWEISEALDQPQLQPDIRPAVFQRVLHLAIMLAAQGREGKSVGVLMVLGDTDQVLKYSDQMILNPFHGYSPAHRDILDDTLVETIREFAILDGAFLIRGNGEIVSAGAYLRPKVPGEPLPAGLGARHATAAAITATTRCVAVTISESTGDVRIWHAGRMVTEIKKAEGFLLETPQSPEDEGQSASEPGPG